MLEGRLLDFSTIYAVEFLLSGRCPAGRYQPLLEFEDFPIALSWEFHCLEMLIESLLLDETVFLPAILNRSDVEHVSPILEHPAVKSLPAQWKLNSKAVAQMEELLSGDEATKQRLWDVSCYLLDNVPAYSLRWEIRSHAWNATIVSDCVGSKKLLTLAPVGISEEGDNSWAYEYMIKTIYYDALARELGLNYSPHPIRVPFLLACNCASVSDRPISDLVFGEIEAFRRKIIPTSDIELLQVPPLLSYVLSNVDVRGEILPFCLTLRESTACKQFRSKMNELGSRLEQGTGGIGFSQYVADLQSMFDVFKMSLGIEKEKAQSHLWVARVPVTIPSFFYRSLFVGKKWHLNWLKDVTRTAVDSVDITPKLRQLFQS